jgi:hypothetical protein
VAPTSELPSRLVVHNYLLDDATILAIDEDYDVMMWEKHGVIAVAIAFGSVLWQTLKAAKTNPAIELKKE